MRSPRRVAPELAMVVKRQATIEALSIDRGVWTRPELARWWRVELSLDSERPPWKQSGSIRVAHIAGHRTTMAQKVAGMGSSESALALCIGPAMLEEGGLE